MRGDILDRRVDIKQRVTTRDAIGQPLESWNLLATVWANIKYQSGLSAIRGDADTSIVKASIRINYRTGLDAGMRIVYGTENFEIQALLPVGANDYLDLVCECVQ